MESNSIVGLLHPVINPWDEGWTFGQDQKNLSQEAVEEATEQKRINSRFFLPSFHYQTLRFRYDIDRYLNLKVKKPVLLSMTPRVLRYNSLREGRFGIYALTDGIYLMKTALEKQYLDPSAQGFIDVSENTDYLRDIYEKELRTQQIILNTDDLRKKHHVSIVKRLVRVINGHIIAPVEFEVKDLRIMRIRSILMVQLESVEEWRHYMVKLYHEFYERQVGELMINRNVLNPNSFERLQKEKIRNIEKNY